MSTVYSFRSGYFSLSSSTASLEELEGGRQTGGESQYQHVPASLEQGLDGLHILVHVDCGGGSHLAGTEALVEEMGVHLPVVGVVVVSRPRRW